MTEEKNGNIHVETALGETDENLTDQGSAPVAAPEEVKKPAAPFALGIILVVCASLYGIYGIFGGMFTMLASQFSRTLGGFGNLAGSGPNLFTNMMGSLEIVYMTRGILQIIAGLISIMALVAGIGLISYKERGRKLSLIWAVTALGFLIVDLFIQFVFILPATSRMMSGMMKAMENLPRGQGMPHGLESTMSGLTSMAGSFQVIAGNMILAALPCVVLFLLRQQDAKDSCD